MCQVISTNSNTYCISNKIDLLVDLLYLHKFFLEVTLLLDIRNFLIVLPGVQKQAEAY